MQACIYHTLFRIADCVKVIKELSWFTCKKYNRASSLFLIQQVEVKGSSISKQRRNICKINVVRKCLNFFILLGTFVVGFFVVFSCSERLLMRLLVLLPTWHSGQNCCHLKCIYLGIHQWTSQKKKKPGCSGVF